MQLLSQKKIAIFGIGGVGSYVCEALARCGINNFVLIDGDSVDISNINRQIEATLDTVGKRKVEVMKERILSINQNAKVDIYDQFYLPGDELNIIDSSLSYIVDAIDTISAKIDIIIRAQQLNIPIISAMGAGNKLDPTKLEISDIYKTSVCPLARVMRYELKKRNIKSLKVVYSREIPIKLDDAPMNSQNKRVPGSISFVPSAMGLIIASEIIRDIIS